MVALFFLSIALGTAHGRHCSPATTTTSTRCRTSCMLGGAAIVVGGVLLAIVKPVTRLMNGVH